MPSANSKPVVHRRNNLSCMTKKELQDLAKARSNPIPHMWKLNKPDLLDAMRKKKSSAKK